MHQTAWLASLDSIQSFGSWWVVWDWAVIGWFWQSQLLVGGFLDESALNRPKSRKQPIRRERLKKKRKYFLGHVEEFWILFLYIWGFLTQYEGSLELNSWNHFRSKRNRDEKYNPPFCNHLGLLPRILMAVSKLPSSWFLLNREDHFYDFFFKIRVWKYSMAEHSMAFLEFHPVLGFKISVFCWKVLVSSALILQKNLHPHQFLKITWYLFLQTRPTHFHKSTDLASKSSLSRSYSQWYWVLVFAA